MYILGDPCPFHGNAAAADLTTRSSSLHPEWRPRIIAKPSRAIEHHAFNPTLRDAVDILRFPTATETPARNLLIDR